MTHETLRDLTFKMRDGEADAAETAAARAHLGACADCRRDLEAWDKSAPALFAEVPPSEGFVQRVMEGLPMTWAERLRAWASPVPLHWVAAGGFAAALAIFYPAFQRPAAPPRVATAATAAPTDWVADVSFAETDQREGIGTAIEEYFL